MKNDNGGIEPIGGKQGGMEPTSDLAGGPSAMREAGIEDDKRMLQSRDKGSKAMDAADGLRRASSGDRVFDSIMRGATLYGVTRVGIAMTNGVIRGATKLVSWLRKIEREYQDEDLNAR